MLDNEFVHIKLNYCNELICCTFIKVICISPTYELALQTGQVAEKMGKFCPEVKIGYAVRGERGEKLEPGKIIVQDIRVGLKGEYHPVSLRGVNFGFFVLLTKTKNKMPIFLAS